MLKLSAYVSVPEPLALPPAVARGLTPDVGFPVAIAPPCHNDDTGAKISSFLLVYTPPVR